MVLETKLDNSFPVSPFLIDDYTASFRPDHDNNRGGIMVFVKQNIPCKLWSEESHPMEGFYVEFNSQKNKWLLLLLQPK